MTSYPHGEYDESRNGVMGKLSKVEWCTHSFNAHWGCSKVRGDPACHFCYAEAFAKRVGQKVWGSGSPRRFFGDKHWAEPVKWDREAAAVGERARVFCASMADVFEDRRDLDEHRARLWELIDVTPNLDWLLLTKRPKNIGPMLATRQRENVWLGTTAATQEWVAPRISALLENEAAVHFLSCEPMLGPIDLTGAFRRRLRPGYEWRECLCDEIDPSDRPCVSCAAQRGVGWVICGAESGPKARPMKEEWVRSLRDQCIAANVPFFYKQAVESGRKIPRPELDGRTWLQMPERSTHDGHPRAPDLAPEAAEAP